MIVQQSFPSFILPFIRIIHVWSSRYACAGSSRCYFLHHSFLSINCTMGGLPGHTLSPRLMIGRFILGGEDSHGGFSDGDIDSFFDSLKHIFLHIWDTMFRTQFFQLGCTALILQHR